MTNYNVIQENYSAMIEGALDGYILKTGEKYDIVKEAMQYSLKSGGKRVRPTLLMEFCRMNGGNIDRALPFACALEMIHCYSLIHDDLPCMDDDDMRRGKPSCHKKFGEANALLAGDALLTMAFKILSEPISDVSDATKLRAINILASASGIDGMIGGQVMDLIYEKKQADDQTLHELHIKKTGALFAAACTIGAIVANASQENINKAKDYADAMGLAFQIIDDVLDVEGTVEVLGKPQGSDEQNGKTTFVTVYGLESAKGIAKRIIEQAEDILAGFEDNCFLRELTKRLYERISTK